MAVEERDPHSGYLTTGHEWNGIKELNSPVPRLVFFFLGATFLFSLIYWVLMPAFPTGLSYTRGLLGIDQRQSVAADLRQATLDRAAWVKQIETADYAAIQADTRLMKIVRETGRSLFGDNCAVCHGLAGKGGPGFPDLAAGQWLWGGMPDQIFETIRVGINAPHDKSRVAMMPAFGNTDVLPAKDIAAVASFVQSLAHPAALSPAEATQVPAGKQVFAANCASCHGEDAKGKQDVGAPGLFGPSWIYGGDRDSIIASLYRGRQGWMPSWEGRLTPVDRKILTLYVLDLGRAR